MDETDSTVTRCPACFGAPSQPVWATAPPATFTLRRCDGCGLMFTAPALAADAIRAYYDDSYYGAMNVRFNSVFESLILWFRTRRARKLLRMCPPGRVLDVGCGRGHILAFLASRGWDVHGVELNESAARHARDSLGLDVSIGGFDAVQFPPEHFDVVILWHVLEHLSDVRTTLDGVLRIVKPGGLVVIAVPNIASWQARLTRYHWFHLDLPRHYVHFSEAWLREKLASLNLRIVEVNHFAFEQNPFGWVQSVLNACGIRQNLLYNLLKSRSARNIDSPWRQLPIQSFFSLLGFVLLLPLACFMLLPECIFRSGPTIEIYARRETLGGQDGSAD